MEKNRRWDKSFDEPNAKRPRLEANSSKSSKPKAKEPFLTLPSDVLTKIISYVPVAQWPALERLDEHFRASTWIAWRQLRNVNMDRQFSIKSEKEKHRSLYRKSVDSFLQKLVERSPFLTSLSGIEIRSDDAVQLVSQFEHLQSITVGDHRWLNVRAPGTPFDNVIEFLKSTRSRTNLLKELCFINVDQPSQSYRDRFASSLLSGREIWRPLRLDTFQFAPSVLIFSGCLYIRLDTMDTTRLADLRLGQALVEPDELSNLIERSPNLHRIELAFMKCHPHYSECNGGSLQANKNVLTALAACENLTTLKCIYFGGRQECECATFGSEFIEMLQAIGRRGRLRKLAIDHSFFYLSTFNLGEIYTTICNDLPYLQSIKMYVNGDNGDELIHRMVRSLQDLEEIHLVNFHVPMSKDCMKEIARLPYLKRLTFDGFNHKKDKNSFKYLASSTTLTDLRIRRARWISSDILESWRNGFASNIEVLMLSTSADEYNHEDEGLIRFLEKATRLRVLILQRCITNPILTTIANSCPELEILGVKSTCDKTGIRYSSVQEILDRCPKLKRLGGFNNWIRNNLRFPKYRKIDVVDMKFSAYDFDDDEYD